MVERAKRILGVAYYSVAEEVDRDLAAVEQAAWNQLAGQSFRTFAIRARRADKTLPFRSQDAERRIGRTVLDNLPLNRTVSSYVNLVPGVVFDPISVSGVAFGSAVVPGMGLLNVDLEVTELSASLVLIRQVLQKLGVARSTIITQYEPEEIVHPVFE